MTDDGHDFNDVVRNPVKDTIYTAYTPPVAGFNKVNRLKGKWSFSNNFKTIKEPIEILVCLRGAKSLNTVLMNSDQVAFGGITQPVTSHSANLSIALECPLWSPR